ncbi:MAG: GDP-mannose 4,6-dehydratase [Desulfosporosinus sp.]|nr:GDP-mannose 4,6-dehydratase [Desulfosporosinus sp.]
MNKALITGITGQDGSYLTEFLLYKGSEHKIKMYYSIKGRDEASAETRIAKSSPPLRID